jgi:hypothetical protein
MISTLASVQGRVIKTVMYVNKQEALLTKIMDIH